jgi:serine/threonine-protein kinase
MPPHPIPAAGGTRLHDCRGAGGRVDRGPDSDLASDLPSDLGGDLGADAGGDLGIDLGGEGGADADNLSEQPTLSHIGRYALKSQIGEGGLGRVYEAWDPLLSRAVAVKTLQFDLDMPSRIALDRVLLNEARAAANLDHPYIVTVFDAGLSAHGVYIAMERLHGRDLRQALAAGWRPRPAVAAQLVRRVADALAYAHAHGVIHCDIKPANIFVTGKCRPKVLDFGIARAATASSVAGARDATVAGSPHYLAPEQLTGGTIDARTDLHALGVVLYELLTGRKAFPGDSLAAIQAAVLEHAPPPAHELCPEVPPSLSAIVARAMARDPVERFGTAVEMSQALRRWQTAAGSDRPGSVAARRPDAARRAWAAAGLVLLAATALGWGWRAVAPPERAPAQPVAAAAPPAPVAAAQPANPSNPAAQDAPAAAAAALPTTQVSPSIPPEGPLPERRTAELAAATDTSPARPATPPAAASARPSAARAGQRAAAPRPTPAAAVSTGPAPAAPPSTGTVQLAVSPWGEIEVDGRSAGTTPPLSRLTLPEGTHQITVRNADFAPFTTTVEVHGDRPVTVRHRFGS